MFYLLCVNVLHGLFSRRQRTANWLQLIPLAIGAISAISQASQAKKQKKAAAEALKVRNPYVDAAADSAAAQAQSTRYPGQDIDESNVRQGVADTFSNISRSTRSGGDVLNAAARLSGSQQRSYQDIAKGRLGYQQNAMDKYRQALMGQAQQQDQNRAYSENLKGAAAQNQYNAWQSALGGAAAAASWGNNPRSNTGYQWGVNTPGDTGAGYNWGF